MKKSKVTCRINSITVKIPCAQLFSSHSTASEGSTTGKGLKKVEKDNEEYAISFHAEAA